MEIHLITMAKIIDRRDLEYYYINELWAKPT